MARTRRELVAQYLRLFLLIVDSLTAVRELASVYIGYRCVTYGVSSVFLKLLLPTLPSIANLARRTIANCTATGCRTFALAFAQCMGSLSNRNESLAGRLECWGTVYFLKG